eukprot:TRINITY_DN1892_c4_g1_i1.p1 TRINITY_DN1892_c4_g1~~TRINITY_DN1892_c4_g1_i1.p1  ORF type:complete len:282 (+),score=20.62 TRINITY_DN1892_c4_g1_i1:57-848(+)
MVYSPLSSPEGAPYQALPTSTNGLGSEAINVKVRADKGGQGDLTVRVTGVNREDDEEENGPWGAKGGLWFFSRLLVFIMCITILSTRYWATGGSYNVDIVMKVDAVGNVSETAYLLRSEIGVVTACFTGWSASASLGALNGEQCGYVFSKWSEQPWLVSLIFGVLFVITLSFRLSLEAAELLNPGHLPIFFQHPTLVGFLRHWTWITMLLTWATFLGGWDNSNFDPLNIKYTQISELGWGFIFWVTLWVLWMIKVILIMLRKI